MNVKAKADPPSIRLDAGVMGYSIVGDPRPGGYYTCYSVEAISEPNGPKRPTYVTGIFSEWSGIGSSKNRQIADSPSTLLVLQSPDEIRALCTEAGVPCPAEEPSND